MYILLQASSGAAQEIVTVTRTVQQNGDTLVRERMLGEWWFGGTGGVNAGTDIGTLRLPSLPSRTDSRLVDVVGGFATGWNAGILSQWKPHERLFSAVLAASIDTRSGSFSTAFADDSTLSSAVRLQYLTVSPSLWYNLGLAFSAFAGFSAEFLLSSDVPQTRLSTRLTNARSAITTEFGQAFVDVTRFRAGFHAGLAWDIPLQRSAEVAPVSIAPMFSLHYGTTVASGNGASWNTLFARLGVAVKFGTSTTSERRLRPVPIPPVTPAISTPQPILQPAKDSVVILNVVPVRLPDTVRSDTTHKFRSQLPRTPSAILPLIPSQMARILEVLPLRVFPTTNAKIFYFSNFLRNLKADEYFYPIVWFVHQHSPIANITSISCIHAYSVRYACCNGSNAGTLVPAICVDGFGF